MPMYEYRCAVCSKKFEALRRIHDDDRELECPDCHSDEIERLLSTFSSGGCAPGGSSRFT